MQKGTWREVRIKIVGRVTVKPLLLARFNGMITEMHMKVILTCKDGSQEVVQFDQTRELLEDIIFDFLRRNVDYHNEDIDLVDMWADWQHYVSVTIEDK